MDRMSSLRLVFAGSPAAAVPSLRALHASRHEVAAVLTRTDSPQGRKRVLTPTVVASAAEELGLPVIKHDRLGAEATDELSALRPDLGVIVAYGGLVREPLLSAPRLGWINLHFSILPRWRGEAPVQNALLVGDQEVGTAVFQLVPQLDAGDVFAQSRRPAGDSSTSGSLLAELADEGAAQLVDVVDALADGTAVAHPQTGEPVPAPKLPATAGRLDPSESSESVFARFRAVTPEPGALVMLGDDRLKVHAVEPDTRVVPAGQLISDAGDVLLGTATSALRLVTVQPAGRTPMPAADWWRGRPADATAVAS